MKKILELTGVLMIFLLLGISCDSDPKIDNGKDGDLEVGQFTLNLGTSGDFEEKASQSGRAGASVNVQDFTVKVYGTSLKGTEVDSIWERFQDMPTIISIPAGSYTIEAFNGEQRSGFDTPYYYGTREFSVGIQELTDAKVVCRLACIKMSVNFTDLFLDNVSDGICLITTTNGDVLKFLPNETRDGYVAIPSDQILSVNITGIYKEDNSELDQTYYINSVKAADWHKITVSVNTMAGLNGDLLELDHTLNEKESTVMIPGGKDVIENNGDDGEWGNEGGDPDPGPGPDPEPGEPTISGVGFDIDEVLEASASDENTQIDVKIECEAGLESLIVTIDSPVLTDEVLGAAGLSKSFDIVNVESDRVRLALETLGLLGVDEDIKGYTEHLFSVGSFMSLLGMYQDAYNENHKFILTVKDANDRVIEKTLNIYLVQ